MLRTTGWIILVLVIIAVIATISIQKMPKRDSSEEKDRVLAQKRELLWSEEVVIRLYKPDRFEEITLHKNSWLPRPIDLGGWGHEMWIVSFPPSNMKIWVRASKTADNLSGKAPKEMTLQEFTEYRWEEKIFDFTLPPDSSEEKVKAKIYIKRGY